VEGPVLKLGVGGVCLFFGAFIINDQQVVIDGHLHVLGGIDPGEFGADHIVVLR
jgi:hypothetical protein